MKRTLLFVIIFIQFGALAQQKYFKKMPNTKWVDSVFNTLSPDERIAQLIMIAAVSDTKKALVDTMFSRSEVVKDYIQKYKVGGLIFFQGSPYKQAALTNTYQSMSKVPLLVAIDGEWGLNMRLDSTLRLPYQMTLGAVQNNFDHIYDMGLEMAWACRRMGVHLNFAPTVDVNNNANNPVINFRSFGENPMDVYDRAAHYMRGMQDGGLLTSIKHFPGHGDTGTDSHYDLPVIKHDKKHLDEVELVPFKKLIQAGADGVMIAHLSIPALDSTKNLPSTLSKPIVTDLLKNQLGFKGLIYSDAMNMSGLTKYFKDGQAEVMGLKAGMDVLEFVPDIPKAIEAIKKAVKDGVLSQKDIDEKCRKVLLAKSSVGLDDYQAAELSNLTSDLNSPKAVAINRKLYEASVTLLKNDDQLLPLKDLTKTIYTVSIESKKETPFQKMVNYYTNTKHFNIHAKMPEDSIGLIINTLKEQPFFIAAFHQSNIRAGRFNYGLNDFNLNIVDRLLATQKAVLTIFGNPYSLAKIKDLKRAKSLVLAYQETSEAEEVAAQAIMGAFGFSGKLPVTISPDLPYGFGLETQSLQRLAHGPAEMVGIHAERLSYRIDDLMARAMEDKATPGAVIEIIKDGYVIFNKAYGKHGFEINDPNTQSTDLYDLASITKIATSALGLMDMVGQNKIDLKSPLSTYYPAWKGTNKEQMTISDLLTHTAGLKAWIPFWTTCLDSVKIVRNSQTFKDKYSSKYKGSLFERIFNKKKIDQRLRLAIKAEKTMWNESLKTSKLIWKSGSFSTDSSLTHPTFVAPGLYLAANFKENIHKMIAQSANNATKEYVYSDMGFYIYPEVIETLSGQKWTEYLSDKYAKIGANSLTYNPLNKFSASQVVPTENDTIFRKTHIRGHVHDEGAAMLNGISGHAGLFGNAHDLSKLMFLYLNKGKSAGEHILKPDVVDQFTAYQSASHHRGLAFEKPNKTRSNTAASCSDSSYGHSGFTGTYTWVDPQYNLVFTMLTNRVNPTRDNRKLIANNVRTNILEAVYTEIKNKD